MLVLARRCANYGERVVAAMSLPKPYYEEEGITIYHADCREILPYLPKVDLVLTDPPYGISFVSNHRFTKYATITNDDMLPLDLIYLSMNKATHAAYVFCRWDNLPQMPKPKSVLAWVKNNWSMGDLEHEHGRQWEACCFYPKEEHVFIKRIPDVIYANRTGNDLHPTEKPQELLETIILANECRLILDPFMGSGTTLRAAKDLRRKAIGIEIEEKYCEIAARRLAQTVLPL
jgi:site-specific DNA-methyltransferase (adenine-specific)